MADHISFFMSCATEPRRVDVAENEPLAIPLRLVDGHAGAHVVEKLVEAFLAVLEAIEQTHVVQGHGRYVPECFHQAGVSREKPPGLLARPMTPTVLPCTFSGAKSTFSSFT